MNKGLGYASATVLLLGMLAGCGTKDTAATSPPAVSPSPTVSPAPAGSPSPVDAVTSASIVNTNEAFLKAISKEGTWIIAPLTDLAFDQELIVEGEFVNKDAVIRKLALYTQDADRNITGAFTVTAPKLTIKSGNTILMGGIFKGDVYVTTNGFSLRKAKIQGNLYFTKDEYKASFDQTDEGPVTGVIAVQDQK